MLSLPRGWRPILFCVWLAECFCARELKPLDCNLLSVDPLVYRNHSSFEEEDCVRVASHDDLRAASGLIGSFIGLQVVLFIRFGADDTSFVDSTDLYALVREGKAAGLFTVSDTG